MYDATVTAGKFPSEVRWQLCDMAGGAPAEARFLVTESRGCERELSPGVVASISRTPVNGSCAGVDAPAVVIRVPALLDAPVVLVEPYFEDRTSSGGGTIFKAAVAHDGFAITWDDRPPGSSTDCDLDILATTHWTARLLDEDDQTGILELAVSNNIGATDTYDNDGAGAMQRGI